MSVLPELPEPYTRLSNYPLDGTQIDVFTECQLREYGDARAAHARQQALEEDRDCITAIAESNELVSNTQGTQAADECLTAIEGLIK